jgi:nucleotide-binding universal stress UspA family protein
MRPGRADRVWQGIVAGFDEGDGGRCAVRWGAEQASWHGCPLYAVRVLELTTPVMAGWMPPMPSLSTGYRGADEGQLLDEVEACADRFPGLEVYSSLHDGRPSSRLADYGRQVDADVIAVGGSDRSRLARLLLGSTVDDLVRIAGRPVVVVRDLSPVQQANLLIGQSPVVVGIEGVPGSGPILDFAFDAAGNSGSDLTVVVPAALGLEACLDGWRQRFSDVSVTVHPVADALRTLLELSEAAQLLVVGDQPRGPVRWLRRGSAVIHHAACSVAVIGSDQPERAAPFSTTERPWAQR